MSKKTNEQEKTEVATPDNKVAEITKDIKNLEKKSGGFAVIMTQEEFDKANAFLIELKGRLNRVNDIVEFFTKPHKEARKRALEAMNEIAAKFAESIASYEKVEKAIKRSMSDYRLMIEKEAREKEEAARKTAEEQRKKDDAARQKAIDAGKPVPPPAPMPVAPTPVERPAATTRTSAGKSTAKKVIKFRVLDANAIPKKYRDLVYAEAVKAGILDKILKPIVNVEGMDCKIAGVEVYEDFDFAVSA